MTQTPVIEVPVDDSAFQRFSAAFEDYNDKLKDMPAAWQAMNSRVAELAKLQRAVGVSSDAAWGGAIAAATAYERTVKSASKAQDHLGATTLRAGSAMGRMAVHAKSVKDHLFGAVRMLARFSALSVGGGLLGGGGLMFGLDEIAGRVLATQRSAGGLNLSSGQYGSYLANMKPYVGLGPLAAAANVRYDRSTAGDLSAMNLSRGSLKSLTPAEIVGREMLAIRRDYAANPSMQSAWWGSANARGFSNPDILRIVHARPGAINASIAAMERDSSTMGYSRKVAAEWTAFDIQLDKAKTMIGSAFITALTPVIPQLTALSKEAAAFIISLEKSGDVKRWINDLADGLKDLAKWLHPFKTPASHPGAPAAAHHGMPSGPASAELIRRAHIMERLGGVNSQDINTLTKRAGAKYHVPVWLLRAQAQRESDYGRILVNKKTGAAGVMQFIPATAKALGITDVLDPTQNIMGAGRLDQALLQKYHGDWRKVIGGYDWGLANVDKDVALHGKDWLRYAPAETRNYVAAVEKMHHPAPNAVASVPPGAVTLHPLGGGAMAAPGVPAALNGLTRALRRPQAPPHIKVTVNSPPGSRVYVAANTASVGGGGGGGGV